MHTKDNAEIRRKPHLPPRWEIFIFNFKVLLGTKNRVVVVRVKGQGRVRLQREYFVVMVQLCIPRVAVTFVKTPRTVCQKERILLHVNLKINTCFLHF